MRNILVPTDFSAPSLPSFRFAIDLAAKVEGRIFLVHVIELPLIQETTFGIQPMTFDAGVLRDLESKAEAAFERFRVQTPANVPVRFCSLHGDIVPGIRSFAERNEIDLIVMSTHGASAFDDFFLGSTTVKTARLSPVPIISIPRETPLDSIKNIVFPNTLELGQDALVTQLIELQSILNATVHLLFVNTPTAFQSDEEATQRLARFAGYYSLTNCTLNHRNDDNEADGIARFMHETNADMLAMATHGRTGLAHLIKGSIAESLVYTIDRPMWISKLNV